MGERRDPADTHPPDGAVDRSGGVIVHDALGRIVSASPRALALLGVTLNQLRAEVPRPPVWTATEPAAATVPRARECPPDGLDQLTSDVVTILGRSCQAAWVICVELDRAHGMARITHQWSRSGATWPHAARGLPIDTLAR